MKTARHSKLRITSSTSTARNSRSSKDPGRRVQAIKKPPITERPAITMVFDYNFCTERIVSSLHRLVASRTFSAEKHRAGARHSSKQAEIAEEKERSIPESQSERRVQARAQCWGAQAHTCGLLFQGPKRIIHPDKYQISARWTLGSVAFHLKRKITKIWTMILCSSCMLYVPNS